MKLKESLFHSIDWEMLQTEEHKGESGTSYWRIYETDDFRVRMIEYSPEFRLEHFCSKGHIILVVDGKLSLEIKNNGKIELEEGMSFLIGDSQKNSHLAFTKTGAKVFIVD
jgi:mannose-6-phosphate isomerase class I